MPANTICAHENEQDRELRERELTLSGFPVMAEMALVVSEKMGSMSTPSRLTLVER